MCKRGAGKCRFSGPSSRGKRKMHYIQEIVRRQKQGEAAGIYSCCSANEYVLRASMQRAKACGTPLLIEATANQVNQDGGYTGMKPADFFAFAKDLALQEGLPEDLLILGGDHLGPLTWTNLTEKAAMDKASELVRQYVEAGFTKIHIDTSMRAADDDASVRLSDEVIAARGAFLCETAEKAYRSRKAANPGAAAPVYIIGSEVPIPGGAQETEGSISVTTPEDCEKTIQAFHGKFLERNLSDAWERVVGIVVQPGVEFGDTEVFDYDRAKAGRLITYMKKNGQFVLEGHSTDYQTKENLKCMTEDGIAILKVGPALTFAMREGLFALESMETELLKDRGIPLCRMRDTLEAVMLESPDNWKKHYHGDEADLKFARAFSQSDRCRYYLNDERVKNSIEVLLVNLDSVAIPYTLLRQYMPVQYRKVRSGELENKAEALLLDHIGDCCDDYLYATVG